MNCKDCLHYEACVKHYTQGQLTMINGDCSTFTDRSKWVHLPCKVGDKVYIVKSRTSDNKNLYIIEDVVKRIVFDKSEDTGFIRSRIEFFNTSSVSDWLFQNIFLTREEALEGME